MPASRVGPRDLGGISLYWRAHRRAHLARQFAIDPRRGQRGRDGLRDPRTDRDGSMNFRPVLLAGLGEWAALARFAERYDGEGHQLREWNSPTYTPRVLAALAVGARLAGGPQGATLARAAGTWCDLLALMTIETRPGARRGRMGGVDVKARVHDLHTCPAGMRANAWTGLVHGATDLLGVLVDWPGARRRAVRRELRRDGTIPMPTDPGRHRKPIPDRCLASVLAVLGERPAPGAPAGEILPGARRSELRRVVRGDAAAILAVAARLERAPVRAFGPLRVRVQRREREVIAALSRATSRLKPAVTAARLRQREAEIQAVSPLRPVSPQPRVTWSEDGCTAECAVSGRRSTIHWMGDPVVDLVIDRGGVDIR